MKQSEITRLGPARFAALVEFVNPKTHTPVTFLIKWLATSVECCPGNEIIFPADEVPVSGWNTDHERPELRSIQCRGCGTRYAAPADAREVSK